MTEPLTYTERIKEQEKALEAMIDSESLARVLENLETVCLEKAEHLRTNWQDEAAAKSWESLALRIDRAAVLALDKGI
jgi:hypothetical protein